jgi:hypothetical protein
MSDPASPKPTPTGDAPAAPDSAPMVAKPAPVTPPRRDAAAPSLSRGGAGAVLTALAVALLVTGLAVVWQQQRETEAAMVPAADVAALREQLRTLQQRLAQLEQRPAAGPAPAVDLRPLEGRVAALEQRPAPAAQPVPDPGLADRMAALDRRLAHAEQAATQAQQASAARLARIARLQAAMAALEAGRALGEIPGAPPALARFAATPPPSEAGLRLAFPAAAQRARDASRTGGDEAGIGERVWQRVRALVTVKEGETVLLGSPAATTLGLAGEKLAAGDLAGSVAALGGLDPGAAAEMAAWRGQAEALLAARVALSKMAAE